MSEFSPPVELTWNAPSHIFVRRTFWWYVWAFLILLLLLTYSVFTQAYTFTVVLVVAGFIYIWMQQKHPEEQHHSISKRGFMWGQQLMLWDHCKSFWIVKHQTHFQLHVTQRKFLFSEVCVHIPEKDVEVIFNAMSNYAVYDKAKGEGWLHYFIRISKL